jgi:hypothetical protein
VNTARPSENGQPRNRVGVSGWKITKRKHQGKEGILAELTLKGLLLKTDQCGRTSSREWWRMRTLVRVEGQGGVI